MNHGSSLIVVAEELSEGALLTSSLAGFDLTLRACLTTVSLAIILLFATLTSYLGEISFSFAVESSSEEKSSDSTDDDS